MKNDQQRFLCLAGLAGRLIFCACLLQNGLAWGASSGPCMNNAEQVVVRGTVSNEHVKASDGRELVVWMLTTENPVCINATIEGDMLQKSHTYITRIQVLGPTPPTDVLVEINGSLKTGNSTQYYAVPNILMINSVTKVNKVTAPVSEAGPVTASQKVSHKESTEVKPQKVTKVAHAPELKVQTIPRPITEALQTAKQMALLYKVDSLEIELDDTPGAAGYSIYLHYRKDTFADHLASQKALIAFDNNYNLAREFIKQLIKIGQDPVNKSDSRYVDVCSEVDSVSPITQKPEFELIGCARYAPDKDMIDPDFTKISERLAAPK